MRRLFHRTHIWLGWIVGAQLILWMLSGLIMSALPIEQVRGEHLKRESPAAPLLGGSYVPPEIILAQVPKASELTLAHLLDRPVYRLSDAGRPLALVDATTGLPLTIDQDLARQIAAARYAGTGTIASVRRVPDGEAVREFRRDAPAFAVTFDDDEGSTFYVHAITGDVAAVRTDRWRLFDLMWGLHIMDWREREDFNHPLLITAAALGLASVTGGAGLLLFRLRRRERGARPQPGV
jgi:uncharacterized iron-regulated membrane protein